MARISLNVDQETIDSAGRTFEPVPAGTYTVSVFSITEDTVKSHDGGNFGKPRLKFQFRIADGEEAADGSKQGNRRLFADINNFPGKNKEGKETPSFDLVAIGKAFGANTPEQLADIDTDDWLGEELLVTVTHRRKQHKVGEKWVDIEPAEFREQVRGFRSLDSANTSAAATATVLGKAPSAAPKAKVSGAKFKL